MHVTIFLAAAAFVTSLISGIIGMGGGVLLLATLFCFLPHGEAIPVHAAVQIVSNSTRVLAFLKDVDWRCVGRFALGGCPGAIIGFVLLWSLGQPERSEPYLKLLVGIYVLLIALLPKPKAGPRAPGWWDFPLLGLLAGTAALTVGAMGPLIAPMFVQRNFAKEKLIATKALCQTLLHVLKIPAFLVLGRFDVPRLGMLTILLMLMVIPGTLCGRAILKHVSERSFTKLYRVALLVAGTKVFVYDGLWKLM